MELKTVSSNNVDKVGYDEAKKVLGIVFTSAPYLVYEYQNVPKTVFTNLMKASSIGGYLHEHVKNKYPFRKRNAAPKMSAAKSK